MIAPSPDPLSHRMWFVPDIVAWGLPGLGPIEYVVAEDRDTETVVMYGSAVPGGADQTVSYADLTDHRGNSLPAELSAPRVLVRPRGSVPAFVVGPETPASFRLARNPSAPDPVRTDLLVIELGD